MIRDFEIMIAQLEWQIAAAMDRTRIKDPDDEPILSNTAQAQASAPKIATYPLTL